MEYLTYLVNLFIGREKSLINEQFTGNISKQSLTECKFCRRVIFRLRFPVVI